MTQLQLDQGTYVFQELFQLFMLMGLDQHVLVVDVLYDECVAVLVVYPGEDGLDGWIALDQNAFRID
jgi:hypothetical protein